MKVSLAALAAVPRGCYDRQVVGENTPNGMATTAFELAFRITYPLEMVHQEKSLNSFSVSNSVGRIYKPYFNKKTYEIKKLAEARAEERNGFHDEPQQPKSYPASSRSKRTSG